MTEPIPGPRALPFVGNLLDIWQDRDIPLRGLERVAEAYGPIYQAMLGGKRRIVISSAALLEELTDEKRFSKVPPPSVSNGPGPKGLFVAKNEDPDWHQGHRILMPAFAPFSVQSMFPDMKDIANQLILSWARKGPEHKILATEDFTRLTLDTIALCTMSFRFNSFYTDSMHPFVDAMLYVFSENTARTTRPAIATKLRYKANKEFDDARHLMRKISQDIVTNRRANPVDKPDVLNTMIYGKDPKTGQVMRDELITEQMLTFLIAGHETTSGLLSFATAFLLKNPHTYLKAQKEVDEIIGKRSIEVSDLQNFKYLNAVLRETARLSPTVPVLQKHVNPAIAHEVVTLDNGRYRIDPNDHIILLMAKCQTDPKVWGENADDFIPERMLDENFDKVMAEYPGAWKPFGNGKRACIGRPFAWQEALLVLAMILQNFDVSLDDPAYSMKIKQTLTIKPADLYIRVKPRDQMDATHMDSLLHTNGASVKTNGANGTTHTINTKKGVADTKSSAATNGTSKGESTKTKDSKPILILYGSNTGTCQAFAQRIASDVASRGYAPTIDDMDSATGSLPTDKPVIVITSSYEGQPPDNAARFMEWLQECKEGSLAGVEYTVFGCGHRDWTRTFHRVPKLADELLSKCGAKRLVNAGFIDAAKGNLYGDFDDWVDNSFWPKMALEQTQSKIEPTSNVEISTSARASNLRYDVRPALVKSNYVLTSNGEPTKRHMEIELPSDCTYECGDYLAVLPLNSEKKVRRIMNHFGLPWDSVVTIKSDLPSVIPTNVPLAVFDVLRSYVELSEPATKKNIKLLSLHSEDSTDEKYLQELIASSHRYDQEITGKRTSLFDILLHHPSVKLPFGEFLTMLPPLHVRQYSISSSPLANASTCTITYGVIDTAAMSDPEQRYEGVTGNYMQSLTEGDTIQVSVRPSAKKTFRIPADAEKTPLLMFAAGTGLAPFRGFLQHRSIQLQSNPNRKLARALLFLGCRTQTGDRLYAEELDQWVKDGVVEVRYAFSKEKAASNGCAYVPDRMLHDAEDIVNLWRSDARGYVCGTRKFAEGIRDAATKIAIDARARLIEGKGDVSEEEKAKMEARFKEALQERVASDVFD